MAQRYMDFNIASTQPTVGDDGTESGETDTLDYLRSHSSTGCLRIEQERIVFDYAVERLRDV